MKKILGIILITVLAGGAALGGIWGYRYMHREPEIEYETYTVGTADMTRKLTLDGEIQYSSTAAVYPEIQAVVARSSCQVGQAVQEGDTLYVLDDADLQTQIAAVQSEYDQLDIQVRNTCGSEKKVNKVKRSDAERRKADLEADALRDAGFAVRRGEALAIIGSSGSGKSTLLHILGCLDTDYQGKYLLDGVRVRGLSRKKLADIRSRKIGFIFQKYNLVPELSVYENVELPLIYQKIPKAERAERTERVIKLVGLEEKKRARPNQLSGGQQQRVSIARALAAGPDILLADEPTGALDSATGKEIMDLLLKLNGMGMTLTVVTHDPAIGVSPAVIMAQFITEAVILSLMGGITGVFIGTAATFLASEFIAIPLILSARAFVLALCVSVSIGILFSIMPARKAAVLDPVMALGAE